MSRDLICVVRRDTGFPGDARAEHNGATVELCRWLADNNYCRDSARY
jgi:hypothetical protein